MFISNRSYLNKRCIFYKSSLILSTLLLVLLISVFVNIVQPTTVNATSTYSLISTDVNLYSLSSPAFFQSGKEVSISVDENSIVESDTLSVATFTVEVTGVVPADGISVSVNIGGSATLGTDYQVTE